MKNKLEVKQITKLNKENFKKIKEWISPWLKEDNMSDKAIESYIKSSIQKYKLPQIYGLFLNNKLIGMYEFIYNDLPSRPDIYPCLANVYIDETERGKGYSRVLLNSIKNNALKNIKEKELFLYTKENGLYEKYGWKFIKEIDTFIDGERIQRLYRLDLKSSD